jgi:hypothetical protein
MKNRFTIFLLFLSLAYQTFGIQPVVLKNNNKTTLSNYSDNKSKSLLNLFLLIEESEEISEDDFEPDTNPKLYFLSNYKFVPFLNKPHNASKSYDFLNYYKSKLTTHIFLILRNIRI